MQKLCVEKKQATNEGKKASIYLEIIFTKNLSAFLPTKHATMKKSLLAFVPAAFACLLLTNCSKEAVSKSEPTVSTSASDKTAPLTDAIVNDLAPNGVLGQYMVRDSKTIYRGQANSQGSNEIIHLDYIEVPKTLSVAADKKHLTMPYGPSNYVDSGWAYLINYDKVTNIITLEPNAAMIADIEPGSFETLLATYNPKTKEGNFATRFTALSDKGNETQITEYFHK